MRIEEFKDRHKGQRCFLLGSGPSIASMDLSALKDEITFSCNRGYLMFKQLGFPTTYWAIEDFLDAEQWGKEFVELDGVTKFAASDLDMDKSFVSVPFSRQEGFSLAPPFKFGGTVMHFMLQLVAYMGCSEAILLGNDFKWDTTCVSTGSKWTVRGVDENHFDPDYWPNGAKSFPPQPERMRRAFFGARNHGLKVINATPGSALDVFETALYANVLRNEHRLYTQQHPEEIQGVVSLLNELKPHHVIEIGVLSGGSCAQWHDSNTGLVIGVDIQDKTWLTSRLPRFRGVTGKSIDCIQQVQSLLQGQQADFLFIDGDHSYNGVKTDWEMYRHLVRLGGIVAFHDINADPGFFEPWELGGVPKFWRELAWPDKRETSVHADWGGIGVVRM